MKFFSCPKCWEKECICGWEHMSEKEKDKVEFEEFKSLRKKFVKEKDLFGNRILLIRLNLEEMKLLCGRMNIKQTSDGLMVNLKDYSEILSKIENIENLLKLEEK